MEEMNFVNTNNNMKEHLVSGMAYITQCDLSISSRVRDEIIEIFWETLFLNIVSCLLDSGIDAESHEGLLLGLVADLGGKDRVTPLTCHIFFNKFP